MTIKTTFEQLSETEEGNYAFWTQSAKGNLLLAVASVGTGCPHYTLQSSQAWKACKRDLRDRKSKRWLTIGA